MPLKNSPVSFIAGIALSISLLASAVSAHCETIQTREYEVKAAFLFNFAKLTEWPEDAFRLHNKNFELCILGEDPFKSSIELFSHMIISGRSALIKRIAYIDDTTACNLLFVASSERDHVPEIMDHIRNKAILTVSDINGFDTEGGIIALVLKDSRVKFRINLYAARKAKVKISSHLLEVAESVSESGR